jgi:hypothetical protein
VCVCVHRDFRITLYIQGNDNSGKPDTGGKIILKWILRETECKGMDWILLPHNMVQWQVFVNTEINISAQ